MTIKKYQVAVTTPDYLPSLGRVLNFSASAMNRMCRSLLAEHDLSLAHWVILSALWRQDGLLVSELASYSQNDLPAASRIVDRMEIDGTVSRKKDKSDGRSVRVYLTKKGRNLSHLLGFYEDVNKALLKGFTAAEKKQLFDMLERVTENARSA